MSKEKISTKKPIEVFDIDFEPYGILFNMTNTGKGTGNVNQWDGPDWHDTNTMFPLIDTLGYLGRVLGTGSPVVVTEMERHLHTQEALFPTDQPIIFAIAAASDDAPHIENITPVILRPGYVAVLHRGTWHSSAHGVDGDAYYHYLALVYTNEPTTFASITGGPLEVEKF
jgi:ureidoglycolate lyase